MPDAAQCLVVIPTYNERCNIQGLLAAVSATGLPLDILFVDDSNDGTAEEIERCRKVFGQSLGAIHLILRGSKKGLGSAYITGFKWALERKYQQIVQMDADLSHDPAHLHDMLTALGRSDFVVGSRYIPGGGVRNWNPIRKFISRIGCRYANLILRSHLQDFTGGFNAWRRKVMKSIDLDQIHTNGYAFQIEMKYRALKNGFSPQEVPIIFHERREGTSKMSFMIVVEAVYKVWQLKFSIP